MADSQAIKAAGTKLYRGNTDDKDTVTVWTKVNDVTDITGPKKGSSMIDVTQLDAENDEEEVIPGRKTRGSCAVNLNWVEDDPSHSPEAGFIYDRDNDVKRAYAIQWISGRSYEGQAYVEDFEITSRNGDKVAATLSLKFTGADAWPVDKVY